MDVVVAILAIIWSILSIILFFKIWTMTNDVHDITSDVDDIKKMIFLINRKQFPEESNNSDAKGLGNNESRDSVAPNDVIQYGKYKIGDVVYTPSHIGALEIVNCYIDKTYNCKDVSSDTLVGVFEEKDLNIK